MDYVRPAICLDILSIAAQNRSANIHEIADQNQIAPCLIFELLSDLMVAGVLICSVAPDSNLLRLRFGPKAVQAVYLFALNYDSADADSARPHIAGA